MALRKTKSEDRTLPAWLDALVGPLYLDFVAPMPLEEALRRIKAEEKLGFFRYRKIHVDLIPHDADTFGFHVKKWGWQYTNTEARGILKRWDTNSTLVTGRVNIVRYKYIAVSIIWGIGVLLLLLGFFPNTGVFPILLTIFIMILNRSGMRGNRYDVARLIETALEAEADADSPFAGNAAPPALY